MKDPKDVFNIEAGVVRVCIGEAKVGAGYVITMHGSSPGKTDDSTILGAFHSDLWDDPIFKAEVVECVKSWLTRACGSLDIEVIRQKEAVH